jgi:hypothetical protein
LIPILWPTSLKVLPVRIDFLVSSFTIAKLRSNLAIGFLRMKKSKGDVILERVGNESHSCQGYKNLTKKYVKIKD